MKLVAVGSLALTLVAGGCGADDEGPLIAPSKSAVVRGELVPDVHLFGEPVVAQVDVILNREEVDPATVRLRTNFEPYDVVGETQTTRRDIGGFTRLQYRTELHCLGIDCVPRTLKGNASTVSQLPGDPVFLVGQQRDEKRAYEFAAAIVTSGTGRAAKTLGRVVWSPLRSLSRINWYDSSVVGQGFPFVATVAPLPEPDYRVSPTVLGVGLLALALALLALPVALILNRRRRHAGPRAEAGPAPSPLERALQLVEWASRRPSVAERREALEVLAVEVASEDGTTAERAREQGWSPPTPEPEQMTELVASIREEGDATSS